MFVLYIVSRINLNWYGWLVDDTQIWVKSLNFRIFYFNLYIYISYNRN